MSEALDPEAILANRARKESWADKLLVVGVLATLAVIVFSATGWSVALYVSGAIGVVACLVALGLLARKPRHR